MIENLKDLEKLFKLCRKQGVTEIDLGTIRFKLGDLPLEQMKAGKAVIDDLSEDPYADFPGGLLSPEQLTYYSSGGLPDEDPYKEVPET